MALAVDTQRDYDFSDRGSMGVASAAKLYEGAAIGDNASGYARALVAGDRFVGFLIRQADNTSGGNGAINAELRTKGRLKSLPVTGVVITSVGARVYASDDGTFTLTAGSNSPIGKVFAYVSDGYADVDFETYATTIDTADIANEAVSLAKMADLARGSIISGQTANNRPTALVAKTSGQILVGDGTDLASVAMSGDATLAANGALTIAAEAVSVAKMADLARGSIISGQTANNRPAALDAKTSGQILVGDGTDVNSVAVSGEAVLSSAGVVTLRPPNHILPVKKAVTVDATAGARVWTAAEIVGGILDRDCAGGNRTDVLPTAALLAAEISGVRVGTCLPLEVRNTSDAAETITLQSGVGGTDDGLMTVAENNTGLFEILFTNVTGGAEAYTCRKVGTMVSQA